MYEREGDVCDVITKLHIIEASVIVEAANVSKGGGRGDERGGRIRAMNINFLYYLTHSFIHSLFIICFP